MQNQILTSCFLLVDAITGYPYVDDQTEENSACHVYDNPERAEEAVASFPGAALSGPEDFDLFELRSRCFAAGGDVLFLEFQNRQTLGLTKNHVAQGYYNPEANYHLGNLIRTRQKKYLRKLAGCRVIVPVTLKNHDDGVDINYAVVFSKGAPEEYLYLVFTDLAEFDAWRADHPGWEGVEVDFESIRWMKKRGIMLNPCGRRLVVSGRDMAAIPNKS